MYIEQLYNGQNLNSFEQIKHEFELSAQDLFIITAQSLYAEGKGMYE